MNEAERANVKHIAKWRGTAWIALDGKKQVEYMNEDELPKRLPDEIYSAMYECSNVDFVRLFPYVTVDGRKLFLISLKEWEAE